MNKIYEAIIISKQAFHQHLNLYIHQQEELAQLLPIIRQIREDHPRMSARVMYWLIQPRTFGRDRFESFCFEHGFKLEVKRSFRRTTNSLGVTRFKNLLEGIELISINQVWVSDITYYEIGSRFYYLTFIMDLYSRRILGYSASDNLFTEHTTIPALKMAMRKRNGVDLRRMIVHSDGGGQYYCKEFLKVTKTAGIFNSMCEDVYGNAHAERINGTIKNSYLEYYKPQNFEQLKNMLTKAVKMYNEQKPHKALNGLSPVAFESLLCDLLTKNTVFNKRKKEAKKEKLQIINNFV
jgi:transposase InsO family protein